MFRFVKALVVSSAVLGGSWAAGESQAQAGGWGVSFYSGAPGYSSYYGGYPGYYGGGYGSYYRSYYSGPRFYAYPSYYGYRGGHHHHHHHCH